MAAGLRSSSIVVRFTILHEQALEHSYLGPTDAAHHALKWDSHWQAALGPSHGLWHLLAIS